MPEAVSVRTEPEPLLHEFRRFPAVRVGLHFPGERHEKLRQRLEDVAREFGQPDGEACMRWLLAAPLPRERVEVLASHLTVGESYFFREPETFEALGAHILPTLLRIWSAGCSTGEEPYTIAFVLERLGEALRGWDVTLLATDINPRALRRAAQATYGEWSFRGVPARAVNRSDMERLCQAMESVFAALKRGEAEPDRARRDALLAANDALGDLLAARRPRSCSRAWAGMAPTSFSSSSAAARARSCRTRRAR